MYCNRSPNRIPPPKLSFPRKRESRPTNAILSKTLNLTTTAPFRLGLSLLELTVTLFIVAIISVAVLTLLHHTAEATRSVDEYMTRSAAIQHSLDMLEADLTAAVEDKDLQLIVRNENLGGRLSSHLTLRTGNPKAAQPRSQIDWIAVARYDDDDLVLFRRQTTPRAKEPALYIPLCQHLRSFDVEQLNTTGEALRDPNLPTPMIRISAELYRPGPRDPDRLFAVSRTLCLRRFE